MPWTREPPSKSGMYYVRYDGKNEEAVCIAPDGSVFGFGAFGRLDISEPAFSQMEFGMRIPSSEELIALQHDAECYRELKTKTITGV